MRRDDLNVKEMIRLYLEKKMTCLDISKKIGCAYTTVLDRLHKNNVKMRIQGFKKGHKINKVDLEEYKSKISSKPLTYERCRELAKEIGISKVLLYLRLKEGGIKPKRRSGKFKECLVCHNSFYTTNGVKKMFCSKKCGYEYRRGKTCEEFYGEKKAKQIMKRMKHPSYLKGKTFEEQWGKKKAKEIRKKINLSKSRNGFVPWNKGLTKETDKRVLKNSIGTSKTIQGMYDNPNSVYNQPEFREKQLKGLLKRPTAFEKRISELCIEHSLPFIYTGDGKFFINLKNPDFVNNKDKVVIEVFYSWFKIRDYGSVEKYKEFCRKKYNPSGWGVIFIDENEVNVDNWKELCLNKIEQCIK